MIYKLYLVANPRSTGMVLAIGNTCADFLEKRLNRTRLFQLLCKRRVVFVLVWGAFRRAGFQPHRSRDFGWVCTELLTLVAGDQGMIQIVEELLPFLKSECPCSFSRKVVLQQNNDPKHTRETAKCCLQQYKVMLLA